MDKLNKQFLITNYLWKKTFLSGIWLSCIMYFQANSERPELELISLREEQNHDVSEVCGTYLWLYVIFTEVW